MVDFFPKMSLKPNTQCSDRYCIQRQKEYNARPKVDKKIEKAADAPAKPIDNEYGIELVSDEEDEPTVSSTTTMNIGAGLKLAYEAPVVDTEAPVESTNNANDGVSLEDLMAQMKSI